MNTAKAKLFLALGLVLAIASSQAGEKKDPSELSREAQKTGVCELHQEKMTKKRVPIEYGLPPPLSEYEQKLLKAEQASFPHAHDRVLGGCIVTEEKEREIFECETCRMKKEAWLKENPKPAARENK